MKILEVIAHYHSRDNLEYLFQNRKLYHPNTFFIIVDNCGTFKPPKDFNGEVLQGWQQNNPGYTTAEYHYEGTHEGLEYIWENKYFWHYDYVLASQQDIFFKQGIDKLPTHDFLQTTPNIGEHNPVNTFWTSDIWWGCSMDKFKMGCMYLHEQRVEAKDSLFRAFGDESVPIDKLGNILELKYNYEFHHKEGWINIQDFYHDDKLLCINMCESYPFTTEDGETFNPLHKDNTRWVDRYDEVVKSWIE